MKTVKRIFVGVALIVSVPGFSATTYTATVDGISWTYKVINGHASIGGGTESTAVSKSTSGTITIPSKLGGYSVTSIGAYAFWNCSGLTCVIIPECVTSIGDSAFMGCSGLINMTIPDSVVNIGSSAFKYCSSLTSVTIGNGLTSIEPAFSYCQSLISFVVASNNVTYKSDSGLLLSKDGKMLVVVPGGLTSVTIPDSVTSIGEASFYGCSALTNVIIPNTVTNIGNSAFSHCSGLTSVIISDGVISIGNAVFSWCHGLSSVTIPESVMRIGEDAFRYCGDIRILLPFDYVGSVPDSATIIRYNPHQTVTFDANGGFVLSENKTVDYGSMYGELPLPSRVEGEFQGWGLGDEIINSDSLVMMFDDHTLVAQWKMNQYLVAFDANGGVGGINDVADYGSTIVPPMVTRTGYTFAGWVPGVDATVPASNVNYTAQWQINQYSVTFNANGGVGGMSEKQDYGTAIVIPAVTRAGYTFKGWSPSVPDTVPAANVACTAQWIPNKYTVTFDANGGVGGTSGLMDYDSALIAPTVSRTGYTFKGWSSSLPSTVPLGGATYTAQWMLNKYTVTFDANGGVGGRSSRQDYGSEIVVPTVARTGYTFASWSPSVEVTVPANDVTYVAQWTPNKYTVIFDANGGVGGTSGLLDYDSTLIAPIVTRTGCTFNGWSPSVPETVPLNGATYTAQWAINRYAVTFDANGGRGGESRDFEHGSNLKAPVVTRKDYDFVGWFTAAEGGSEVTAGSAVTGEMTLYAHWVLKPNVWLYEVVDGKAAITGNSTPEGDIAIPSKLDGYPVTAIATNAFYGCVNLTSVTIPQSITEIGEDAFYGCTGLTNLVIEGNVEFVTAGLVQAKFNTRFDRTSTLDSANEQAVVSGTIAAYQKVESSPWEFHDSIMGGTYAWNERNTTFAYFGQMFLEGGKTYVFGAHFDDDAYVKVNGQVLIDVVDSSASRVWTGSFSCVASSWYDVEFRLGDNHSGKGSWGNLWLSDFGLGWRDDGGADSTQSQWKHLLISEARLRCGAASPFSGCTNLKSVAIPSLYSTMSAMFPDSFTGIESVIVTGEATSIPACALSGCASLKSFKIPGTVTSIGNDAFDGCSNLTSVTIADGVTNISWRTEFPCLQEISLPLSLNGVVTRKNVQEIFGCPANVSLIYRGAPSYVTITLDANGGDLGGAESVRRYVLGDVVGALPLPTREGYSFDGWMLADETVAADTVVTMTADCSLVAHWTINSYAISYDPNGGDGTMDETAATYGSEAAVAVNGFTRTGYRFVGWALEPDGEVVYAEGQSVTNLTMESDGVVTLYAAWVLRDGYIESDGSHGAGINTGFFFGPQSKVEIDFQLTEEVNQCRLFGASGSQNNDTDPECECYIGSNNGLKFSYIIGKEGNARQANNFRATDTQRHRIVLDFYAAKQFQIWTGDSVNATTLNPFPTNRQTKPMAFFCKNYTAYGTYSSSMTTLAYPTKMRVYRFRIWDAGVLVRDYVPCVRGGVPGFKETCSGQFVTGENIAAFTAGGDVSEEKDAPYISSSGNSPGQAVSGSSIYMDTGYQFKPNSRIELDYALLANWATNNPYGSQGSDMFDGPTSGSYKLYLFAYGSRADKGYYYWKVGTAEGSIPQIGIATANGVRRTVSANSNTMCIVTAGYTNVVKTASASQAITMDLSGTLKIGDYLPMRIYGFKIYESDVLIRDYRPFVTNGVPGLIDALNSSDSIFPVTYNGGGRTNVVAEAGGDLGGFTTPKEKEAYLEFDGQDGHLIDTGYALSHDSCIEADFSLYSTAYNGQQEFFKQQLSTADPNILARLYINSAYTLSYQFEDYSTYKTAVGINTGISATSNARRQYRLDGYNSRVTIACGDDVLYDQPMEREHNNAGRTPTLKIGTNRACMRLYGFKISEVGEIVRNYVPAVENGQSGLYDLCTKTFLPLEGGQVSSLSQPPSRYTVTFDANGGEGGTSVKQDYRSAIVAPTVTRTGYTFKGWEPEVAAMVPAEDVTYTAQWEINQYTVTFYANGGTGSISETQDYGTAIEALADPVREGYTFRGWSPEVAATVPASNVTYTAQWEINRYVVALNANGGTCDTTELSIEHGATVGELPVLTRAEAVFLGWFTAADGGELYDGEGAVVTSNMTLYAHWLTEVAIPVISTGGVTEFRTNTCEVTITCATEGVTIYYTDDGSTPRMNDSYLYTEPITITETTTFKAVAVIGDIQSDYVTVTITKKLLTLEEALDGGKGVTITTGMNVPWRPVFDDTAKVGDATARSCEIGNRTNTWLSASVSGAGTMTFWCKTSCEHDEDGTFTWDRLMVYTNGVEITDWRMDGETDWTKRMLAFAGGENTVRWVYYKDRTGSEGADCAWVDGVMWMPSGLSCVIVDVGGGKSVTVPETWLSERTQRAATDTAANGRKVWECYALGLNPEDNSATNDFRITSLPMKADGTPDLENIVFDPPQARWNVSGARPVLKGAASLDGPWEVVDEKSGRAVGASLPARFFRVEVELP